MTNLPCLDVGSPWHYATGPNYLKIPVEFTYIPHNWKWIEDVIARCSARLKDANIYDVVYASLLLYDREQGRSYSYWGGARPNDFFLGVIVYFSIFTKHFQ